MLVYQRVVDAGLNMQFRLESRACLQATPQEEIHKKLAERLDNLEAAVFLRECCWRLKGKGCAEFYWDSDQQSLKGFDSLLKIGGIFCRQRKFPATNQQKQSKMGTYFGGIIQCDTLKSFRILVILW